MKVPDLLKFMTAGFMTGTALLIWAYGYFYPRAEASKLELQVKTLHQIHREDMREVKTYLKEIRDAIRSRE